MSALATFEVGTDLIADQETLVFTYGYTDVASAVFRTGRQVTIALDFTATAREAWKEKGTYALGAITTEGGKTYKLIKLEEAAEKEKPTANPTFWEEVKSPLVLLTLPPEYRPAAEVAAFKTGTATVKISAAGVVTLSAAETNKALSVYRAATVSP